MSLNLGHDGDMSYADLYRRSLQDPESFWLEAAGGIDWAHSTPATTRWTATSRPATATGRR